MLNYGDQSWYDVMQACMNGHIITSQARNRPEDLRKRCPVCGVETITQCLKCNTDIQGYKHTPLVSRANPKAPPAHCHQCGKPYPWTVAKEHTVPRNESANTSVQTNEIFVVHGHDEEMKQSVARVLSQLRLNPIILHEQPNQGSTLIEKFEKNAVVQFAVILLSPDDMAYPASASHQSAKPRARQNVILELGYFVGRLTRERVFALKRDDQLEIPTDISGVGYTLYDQAGAWRFELVRELKASGYDVDANVLVYK